MLDGFDARGDGLEGRPEVAGDPADLNSFFGRANALDLGVNAETGEGDAVRERAGAQGASQIPVALVPYIVAGLIEGMEGFCPLRGYLVAVASSAGTTTDVLAHEIGHFFGLRHRDNNRRNLMADGSVRVAGPEGRLLSPWECSVIRSAL